MRALLVLLGIAWALCSAEPACAQRFIEQSELEFGTIAAGQSTGPVSVAPTGAASCGVHTCLGGQGAARFQVVQAQGNTAYSINYSSGDVLAHSSGARTIPLQNLNDDVGGVLRTNNGGVGRFRVGGEIVIGPSTPGGAYSGTYTVLIELQ